MVEHISILREIVENLVHTVEVSKVTNDVGANTSTLEVCNTYYLNILDKVTIDSVVYKVDSFTINEELILIPKTGTTLVDVATTSFVIDPPRWYNGTPKKVTVEKQQDAEKAGFKGPYIWLIENFRILPPEDKDSSLVRSTMEGVNIMFLDDVREPDWTTEQHYENVIYPQNNELEFVFRAFKSRLDIFGELDEPVRTNHPDWGVYIINEGYKNTILTERLSGVQGTFDLPFVVDPVTCCNGKTQKIVICEPSEIILNAINFGEIDTGEIKIIPVLNNDDDVVGVKELFGGEDILRVPGGMGSSTFLLSLTGQEASFADDDDGDQFLIGTYANSILTDYYTLATVNPDFPNHSKRICGDTGGYMDEATGGFFDKDNVATTKALAFPNDILRDYAYRRRWSLLRSGARTWASAVALATTDIEGGETGWRLPSQAEYETLSSNNTKSPTYIDSRLFNFPSFFMWSSTTAKTATTSAFRFNSGGDIFTIAAKTQSNGGAYIKNF